MPPEQSAVERLTHWVASIGLEDVVRYATAGLAAIIVGVPLFKRFQMHVWAPTKELWDSGKSIVGKFTLALEGAALLKGAVVRIDSLAQRFDQFSARIQNLELTVDDIRSNGRAEWEATREPRIRFDAEGRVILVNPTALSILDQSRDEAEGFGWKNAVVPMYREKVAQEMLAAAEDRRHATLAFPVRQKNGTGTDAPHFLLHLVPVTNPTTHDFGGFLGWFSHVNGKECGLPSVCPLAGAGRLDASGS